MKSETFRTFQSITLACSFIWTCGQPLHAGESAISKSIALIIGTPAKLNWAQASMNSLADTFNKDLADQNFQVEMVTASSQQFVLDRIKSLSSRVSKDGTFAISFIGNAAGSSFEMEDGGSLNFQQIGKAITDGRTNPLRRTIFLIEAAGANVLPAEQCKKAIESQLVDSVDWFSVQMNSEKHWQRLITDKSRLKDSGLVAKSFFGEIAVFASTLQSKEKQGVFADAIAAAIRTLHSERRESANLQHFADTLQQNVKTQPFVFVVRPQEVATSTLFDPAPDFTKMDQRYRTQGLGWLNQVSKRLSELLEGCTFGPEDSINYNESFLFEPSFVVTAKSGLVFHDMYFGTMNWMSNPDTTVQMLKEFIIKGDAAQINSLGCKVRPPD